MPKSTEIKIRVEPERKARYDEARGDVPMSRFATRAMDKEADLLLGAPSPEGGSRRSITVIGVDPAKPGGDRSVEHLVEVDKAMKAQYSGSRRRGTTKMKGE